MWSLGSRQADSPAAAPAAAAAAGEVPVGSVAHAEGLVAQGEADCMKVLGELQEAEAAYRDTQAELTQLQRWV
jgi:hypothetical protein